jgi:uncharacterized protein YndB with AHSA1/START domain
MTGTGNGMAGTGDSPAGAAVRAGGTVELGAGDQAVLRFRRRVPYPVRQVWAALTEPAQLAGWWGDAEIDLKVGGAFVLRWRNTAADGSTAVMQAVITELEPPRLLETSGRPHGVLRWELTPDGDSTVLDFSSTVELPEQYRTMVLAGWHWHLDALAPWLGGTAADLVAVTGWDEVHRGYAGPRARTSPFS